MIQEIGLPFIGEQRQPRNIKRKRKQRIPFNIVLTTISGKGWPTNPNI